MGVLMRSVWTPEVTGCGKGYVGVRVGMCLGMWVSEFWTSGIYCA